MPIPQSNLIFVEQAVQPVLENGARSQLTGHDTETHKSRRLGKIDRNAMFR
jgi:hypothetical protein